MWRANRTSFLLPRRLFYLDRACELTWKDLQIRLRPMLIFGEPEKKILLEAVKGALGDVTA